MTIMVIYLIFLRYTRIQAEEWLKANKKILFSHAADLKTEEEILEALVNSKELTNMLKNRNMPTTPTRALPSGLDKDASQRFIDYENDDASDKRSGNGSQNSNNRKPPSKTNFIEPSHKMEWIAAFIAAVRFVCLLQNLPATL